MTRDEWDDIREHCDDIERWYERLESTQTARAIESGTGYPVNDNLAVATRSMGAERMLES